MVGSGPDMTDVLCARWYNPEHCCVVAVGHFADPEAIVQLINEAFGPAARWDGPLTLT